MTEQTLSFAKMFLVITVFCVVSSWAGTLPL